MTREEIEEFLSRLKKVSTKAWEEKTSSKMIYERANRGVYQMIEIDGMKFIVEPKK